MRARILLAAALLLAAGSLTRADDKPLERYEVDKRVSTVVYEASKAGTDIFNKGNHEGCYRLYEGTLLAVVPLLDHRAKVQAIAKKRLENARTMKAADAAFELRTALDEIQNDIAPPKLADPPKKPVDPPVKPVDPPKKPVDPPKDAKTLWERLGGEKAVTAVVHDFVGAAAADPKVDFTRGGKYPIDAKGREKLERSLVEFVSSATGGPLKYTGKTMKESHKGMAITDAEFDALAGHLVATLKKYKVPQEEIDELVKAVAGTKPDIVEKK